MEILNTIPHTPVTAVLFDFDGTISTLRHGWESVMRRLMLDTLPDTPGQAARIDAYIDESTGIQTIHQMKWLAEQVGGDPWAYKAEYNRRLMAHIASRVEDVVSGRVPPEQYMIAGASAFLRALKARGVRLYVASGTDDRDVVREARALGVDGYFDRISGAPDHSEGCSKETVVRMLLDTYGLTGADIAVIGDGKVEIRLVKACGGRALGLATNEAARRGIDPVKRARLIQAGADAIAGDFTQPEQLLSWLGLEA